MGATAQVLLHLLVWENIVGLAKEIKKKFKKKRISFKIAFFKISFIIKSHYSF